MSDPEVTVSYAIPSLCLMTILKELAKAKQTNHQLRKIVQITQPKQSATPQQAVVKRVITCKVISTNAPVSKKTV